MSMTNPMDSACARRWRQRGSLLERHASCARQSGVALIVALILLAVITLVGLGAIGTTLLQNKAAANQYDRQIAFQAAEAALRDAQVAITTATASQTAPAGFEDCSTPAGATSAVTACHPDPFGDAGATSYITSVPTSAFSSALATTPQYVVQYMGQFEAPAGTVRQIGGGAQGYGQRPSGSRSDYYRITARSGNPTDAGATGRANVTLQSTFRH